ncbi:MAG: DoxX family protein, partial [Myxococcales bacterium]|nr:DoxX family protein [Myxococcales bacterium]
MRSRLPRVSTVARYVLGLIFFVFGLNGFLHFIPQPPPEGAAATFMGGLAATGYFFPLLKGTEVVAGALLLSNRLVPLALTVLAPIVVNIVAFHVALAPAALPMAILVLVLEIGLAWAYRDVFAPILRSQAAPASAPARAR